MKIFYSILLFGLLGLGPVSATSLEVDVPKNGGWVTDLAEPGS
jgi:hypothetical protein